MTINAYLEEGNTISVDITDAASRNAAINAATDAEAAQAAAEAAQTGAETAESNAETSATNAANSASAASTSETNAATSATEAEAARDAITDKFSFTGSENDLYQIDASGVGQPISRENLGKQIQLLYRSAAFSNIGAGWLFAYDSFHRADSQNLGTSDSGHDWSFLRTSANTGNRIRDNVAIPIGTDILKIDTGFGSVAIDANVNFAFAVNNRAALYIGKDVNNFYEVDFSSGSTNPFVIRKTIAGVSNSLVLLSSAAPYVSSADQVIQVEFALYYTTNAIYLVLRVPQFNIYEVVDVTSDRSLIFPSETDIAFAGIGRLSVLSDLRRNSSFYNVFIKKLKA